MAITEEDKRIEPDVEPGPPVDADTAYVVNPCVRVVRCTDDELLVKHGTRALFSEIVVDEQRRRLIGAIVDRLRRPGSVSELAADGVAQADDAGEILGYLRDRGVIVAARDRLSQVYLDTIAGGSSRLREATVAVLGSGALARRIAERIAELAPLRLLLAAEQPLDGVAAPDGVQLDRRTVDLTDDHAVRALIEDAALTIVALDAWSPRTLHAVNAAALAREVTWMPAYFDGGEAIIGPTCVPGETACYFEYELQHEASLGMRDEYHLYKEARADEGAEAGAFVLGPFVDTAAGLATTAAMKLLASGSSFAVNRAVHVDFERGSIDYQDVFRLPRCPACAGLRPPQRHLFL